MSTEMVYLDDASKVKMVQRKTYKEKRQKKERGTREDHRITILPSMLIEKLLSSSGSCVCREAARERGRTNALSTLFEEPRFILD